MRLRLWFGLGFALALMGASAAVAAPKDYNGKIMDAVEWLAANRAGRGYDLGSRYTENLSYGGATFRATGGGKTMCVAAVFEVMVRALTAYSGEAKPTELLQAKTLSGSSALQLMPYIFQYRSNAPFPEYKRQFSAGAGDAFVLFGIGRYVTFETAKPGDFLYFNRARNGHAAIFVSYLNAVGQPTDAPKAAVGFRYFSAQEGGTKGMGYRDAFFGACPAVATQYVKDCGIRRSSERSTFAVSRLHDPAEWFTDYSAIRVDRFFKGAPIDKIYADEQRFRARAVEEQTAADRASRAAVKNGVFPLIVTKIAGEDLAATRAMEALDFQPVFGPSFGEN